jgi:hypothetical protein
MIRRMVEKRKEARGQRCWDCWEWNGNVLPAGSLRGEVMA